MTPSPESRGEVLGDGKEFLGYNLKKFHLQLY